MNTPFSSHTCLCNSKYCYYYAVDNAPYATQVHQYWIFDELVDTSLLHVNCHLKTPALHVDFFGHTKQRIYTPVVFLQFLHKYTGPEIFGLELILFIVLPSENFKFPSSPITTRLLARHPQTVCSVILLYHVLFCAPPTSPFAVFDYTLVRLFLISCSPVIFSADEQTVYLCTGLRTSAQWQEASHAFTSRYRTWCWPHFAHLKGHRCELCWCALSMMVHCWSLAFRRNRRCNHGTMAVTLHTWYLGWNHRNTLFISMVETVRHGN